jgi:uncharacterized HAD superfamily protein
MIIAIDIDEVLGQFMKALVEFHNNKYKTNLKLEDFFSYKFWEVWGGTKEEAIQKVYDFHKTNYFKNIIPVKDSQESVKKIKENNKLFIITSRQDDVIEETKNWIEKNFPNTFSNIYFTNHFSKNGIQKTKKEICDLIDIDILIEDSLEYSLECIKPNRKIFLLDYPWNKKDVLPTGIERVYSWKEIMEKF